MSIRHIFCATTPSCPELNILRSFNPLERPNWDAQLTRCLEFSFFHGSAWLKVLANTYGYTPIFFETENGVLPLMEVDSWLTGRRAIALPFTDDCPLLGLNKKSALTLFEAAVAEGRMRGWKYIELRGGKAFFPDAPASLTFREHRLALSPEPEKMFSAMDGSMRQAIRKAEREGVTVDISSSQTALRDFYQLQCLTRKRHGLPPQSWGFFLNIHRFVLSQNLGFVAVASRAGKKIAAGVYFNLSGRAIYKYGASDYAQQHLRGANLVMWTAMQHLAQMGDRELHLGKTSMANEGLRRFKLNLGAGEQVLEYLKYDLRRSQFVTELDGVAGWHNRVFTVLPLFASRLAGRLLYQHWA